LLDPTTGEPAERIDVEIENTRHEEARLVALEPTVDMAVLKVEVPFAVRPVRVGDASRLRIGDWVIAIGDPPGVERTFAPGNVASPAIRDCYQEQRTATLIQTSLAISAQSYGGPLVDIHGEVVGLAVPPRDEPSALGIPSSPAVRALPIQLALTLFEPLRVAETRRSPWIGISVLNLTWRIRREMDSSPQTGIYIENVFDPSPASIAGVRPGDVLVRIDDRRIFAVQDFQKALYLSGIGTKITLELFRDGALFTREVTITDRPPEATTR